MFLWLYINIFYIVLPLECLRKEVRSYLPRSTINSFTPVPVQGKDRKHSLAHPHHSQERGETFNYTTLTRCQDPNEETHGDGFNHLTLRHIKIINRDKEGIDFLLMLISLLEMKD